MKTLITLLFCVSSMFLSAQCIEGDCNNGEGTMLYKTGNKYKGAFKDGRKHGYGKFIWTSGAKYKGNWVNNVRQGHGIELLADGSRYEGNFDNHKKSGYGTLYAADGSVLQQGQWAEGSFIGGATETKPAAISTNTSKKNTGVPFERFINFGVGLGSTYVNTTLPPLSISAEIKKLESGLILGLYGGYVGQNIKVGTVLGQDYGYKYRYIILGGRAIYPVNIFDSPKTTTYIGGMLGYNIVSASFYGDSIYDGGSEANSAMYISGFAGLRHELSEGLMVFGELGYGISYFTGGISKRF